MEYVVSLGLDFSSGLPSHSPVFRLRSTVRFWGPVLIWAAVIFVGSGDLLSENRTSRFLGPFLRWLKPDLSDAAVRQMQVIIRKGGHLSEYGILALLALRAFSRSSRLVPSQWSWRAASLALTLCALYAVTDEFHQSLVASRYGSPLDVLIDTLGAALGLGAAWLDFNWRRWRARRIQASRGVLPRLAVPPPSPCGGERAGERGPVTPKTAA